MSTIFDTMVAETKVLPPVPPLPPGHTRVQRITEAVYSGRSTLQDTAPIEHVVPVLLRRRVATVEAVQVTEDNLHGLALWCDGLVATLTTWGPAVWLNEGGTLARVGDWIVRDEYGEFRLVVADRIGRYEPVLSVVAE